MSSCSVANIKPYVHRRKKDVKDATTSTGQPSSIAPINITEVLQNWENVPHFCFVRISAVLYILLSTQHLGESGSDLSNHCLPSYYAADSCSPGGRLSNCRPASEETCCLLDSSDRHITTLPPGTSFCGKILIGQGAVSSPPTAAQIRR